MWPMRSRRTRRERHFDAAAVADDALVLDALVLSAGALPVTGRTEDPLAEETALLRLERAVVDRLRILDLALATTSGSVSGEATVMDDLSKPHPGRCLAE